MSHSIQLHDNPSSEGNFALMPYTAVFGYLIPTLIGIVGANVQGTTEPLSKSHTANLWSFLVATGVYCFALTSDLSSRLVGSISSQFLGIIAILSGSVSSVSLISTFVPRSIGDIILCLAWICSAIVIVVYRYHRWFEEQSRRLHDEILKPCFSNICNWLRGFNLTPEQQPPPV